MRIERFGFCICTPFPLLGRNLFLRGLTVHIFGNTNLGDYSYACYLWHSWNTSVCPWGYRNDTGPGLSTPGVSAESRRSPWGVAPLQPTYFMILCLSSDEAQSSARARPQRQDYTGTPGLQSPRGLCGTLWLAAQCCGDSFMGTGSSRDLGMQGSPLTGTETQGPLTEGV